MGKVDGSCGVVDEMIEDLIEREVICPDCWHERCSCDEEVVEYVCQVVVYHDTFKELNLFRGEDLVKSFKETMGFLRFSSDGAVDLILRYFREEMMEESLVGMRVTFSLRPLIDHPVNCDWKKAIDVLNGMDKI